MSSKATAWAWGQKIKPSSAKLLLMAIADCANPESGLAFPSIECLVDMTGQDRKTVISGIERLCSRELRLMRDTGARVGRTKQIPVYQLAPWVKDWGESETVGKTGLFQTVPDSDGNSTAFGGEESRKRDTEPSIGTKEGTLPPSSDEEGTPTHDLFGLAAEDPEPEPLEDFVARHWKALKADEPGIADVDVLNPARVKKIEARAAEIVRGRAKNKIEATAEGVWLEIFEKIRRSTFLCGRAPPGKGRTSPFKLTIDYVVRPTEFGRILEGAYDDDERYRNRTGFDALSGRSYGPAEEAIRSSLDGLRPPGDERTSRRDRGGAYGGNPNGAAGGARRLSR